MAEVYLRRGTAGLMELRAALDKLGVKAGEKFTVATIEDPTENKLGPSHRKKTSQAAAQANYINSGTQKGRVLAVIEAGGEDGATREEISKQTGLPGDSVRPRVDELKKDGWIYEDPGRSRKTDAGNDAELLIRTEKPRPQRR